MIGEIVIHMGRIQAKLSLDLYLETVFWALKLTQNCYLHYNINSIENWLFNYKLAPPVWRTTCRSERPSSTFGKIWRQGDKNLNFRTFKWIGENLEVQSKLFENPNFPSLLWIGKNLEAYPAQDQYFNIQILNLRMNWEKLCPSLSSTVHCSSKKDGHILNLT